MPRSMQEVHALGHHAAYPRLRCAECRTHVCPHCGNRDPKLIEDNGCSPSDLDYTLLCIARVSPGEDAFGGDANPPLDVGADGKVVCGMQWCPNEWRDEG